MPLPQLEILSIVPSENDNNAILKGVLYFGNNFGQKFLILTDYILFNN